MRSAHRVLNLNTWDLLIYFLGLKYLESAKTHSLKHTHSHTHTHKFVLCSTYAGLSQALLNPKLEYLILIQSNEHTVQVAMKIK